MLGRMRSWVVGVAVALAGCGSSPSSGGGSGGGGKSYGETPLDTLDAPCGDVAGLTGQAILDQRADSIQTTLAYVTSDAQLVDPTALSMTLGWPATPVATCYPPYPEQGVPLADSRVAIDGLQLHFSTADGKFNETLPAKAWLASVNGSVQTPQLVAVTSRGALKGSWTPMPSYDSGGQTVFFSTHLAGANSNLANGLVGLGNQPASELEAYVVRSSSAIAVWPHSG